MLLGSQGYHVFITTNISVNRMARELEGNMEMAAQRGNITAQGSISWHLFMELLSMASV
jgi:uncharacterized protein YcbX